MNGEFRPPRGLRSPHVQSLLNSSSLRRRIARRRAAALLAAQEEWIMDGGNGIRLLAHVSRQPQQRRGVIVMLHGWEGSSHSNYMMSAGARFFAAGFDVFRLNFRDHGDTHHLNPGIFHSCRLDEVIHALGDMQQRLEARRWGIAGYSLGGNFALRVCLKGPARGLDPGRLFAICPVIDPARVLKAMEDGPTFYENYYIRKWARSVRLKQACFPDRYDYEEWFQMGGLRERTEFFATRYYPFESVEDYYDGYSIGGDRLAGLTVPGVLLTAADDPVVPVSDIEGLPAVEGLEVRVTEHGGHCGYLKNWRLDSWAEELALDTFERHADAAGADNDIESEENVA